MTDTPSMIPKVKIASIWKKGILDLAGIAACVAFVLAGHLEAHEGLVFVGVVLGLMRWKPISEKGGPLAALLAGAAAVASKIHIS